MTTRTALATARRIDATHDHDLPTWPVPMEPLTTLSDPDGYVNQRATQGAAAIRVHAASFHDTPMVVRVAAVDLLASLMCAADALDLDFGALLDDARHEYREVMTDPRP